MRLKLQRKQEQKGLMSKSVSFLLYAKVDLTEQEQHCVSKYKLGGQIIYDSEQFKKNIEAGASSSNTAARLARLAMAKMSMQVTVKSLQDGQTITCSTLDEVIGAERAILDACEALKNYLEVAETFDGREEVIEIETFKTPVAA